MDAKEKVLATMKEAGQPLNAGKIDKERGVIHEEWRMRTSASSRMFERNLPTIYPGSLMVQPSLMLVTFGLCARMQSSLVDNSTSPISISRLLWPMVLACV